MKLLERSKLIRISLLAFVIVTVAVAGTKAFGPEYYCGDSDCNLNNPLIECNPPPAYNNCLLNPGGLYTTCCQIWVAD